MKRNIIFFIYLLAIPVFFTSSLTAQENRNDTVPDTPAVITPSPDTLAVSPDDTLVSSSALEAEVNYTANDSVIFEIEARKVHLYGQAHITYQNIELKAGYVTIDFDRSIIYAEGLKDTVGITRDYPVFSEAGREFRSSRMSYNFRTKRGITYDVITEEGDGYLHGEQVIKDEYDILYINNAKYTTCDLDSPHFHITASRAKIIPRRSIVTGPAYLVLMDVPLFPLILPFGFFPNNERQASGIIIPQYGSEYGGLNRGFYLRNGGYFVTVNDYLNFSVLGDIFARGDYRLELATNYALRYRFSGNLRLQHAMMFKGDRDLEDRLGERQFQINWQHYQDPKARPGSTFSASVNFGSSGFNRHQSANINEMVQNNMSSSVSYSRRWAGTPFAFNTALRHNQNIQTGEVNMSLPNSSFSVARFQPLKRRATVGAARWYENIGMSYNVNFRNEIRTTDTLLFKGEVLDDFRYGFQHTLPVSTNLSLFRFFNMTPSVNYNGRVYFDRWLQQYLAGQDTVITVQESGFFALHEYSFSNSLNTRLYGLMNINRAGIVAVRHVMTSTFNFHYKPDFGTPAYDYYREVQVNPQGDSRKYSLYQPNIYGAPSQGEEGIFGISLGNNFEMKIRNQADTITGTRIIKILDQLSFSSGYNFLADSFQVQLLRISAYTSLFNIVRLNFSGNYSPYVFDASEDRVVPRLEWDENRRIARLTNASFSVSTDLNPRARQEIQPHELPHPMVPMYYYAYREHYINFAIPWNLSLGYVYNYNKTGLIPHINQAIDIRGSLSLTDKWKIGFNSGYDLVLNEPTITSLDLYRDLHCWEMRMDWIPFGDFRRYGFTLKVKSHVLKDLKIDKRDDFRSRF